MIYYSLCQTLMTVRSVHFNHLLYSHKCWHHRALTHTPTIQPNKQDIQAALSRASHQHSFLISYHTTKEKTPNMSSVEYCMYMYNQSCRCNQYHNTSTDNSNIIIFALNPTFQVRFFTETINQGVNLKRSQRIILITAIRQTEINA